jgi:ATP-dependent Clp protease ATP-binding subunit ClpB
VVKTGYDAAYGARPLKRAIQKEIETPLARLLLKGEVPDGGAVTADYDAAHDALTFAAKPASE